MDGDDSATYYVKFYKRDATIMVSLGVASILVTLQVSTSTVKRTVSLLKMSQKLDFEF